MTGQRNVVSDFRTGQAGYCCPRGLTTLYYQGMQAQYGQYAWYKDKISVNDGEFIPGIYRTNPYEVYDSEVRITQEHGKKNKADWPSFIPASFRQYLNAANTAYWVENTAQRYACWQFGEWWRYNLFTLANSRVPLRSASTYEQLSLQKAYGKIRSADLELGETLGEYRETIRMFREPLSSLKKFLLDDKSRNLRLLLALAKRNRREVNLLLGRTGSASVDAMTGTWMELRYGLRPLVMLVQDVIDRVEEKRADLLDPNKIRSAKSKLVFTVETEEDVDVGWTTSSVVRGNCFVRDKYTTSASVQYKQTGTDTFLDTLGLTPRFLPETAWQLTRLSFVVDWLFTIGPWLATLRIKPEVQILGNTSGFKIERTITVNGLSCGCPKYGYPMQDMSYALDVEDFVRYKAYKRQVNVDLSMMPHFTWGRVLDLFKLIDSLSILWQAVPGKIRRR